MRIAILSLMALASLQDPKKPLHVFPQGTAWLYDGGLDSSDIKNKRQSLWTVTEVRNDGTSEMEMTVLEEGVKRPGQGGTGVTLIENDVITWALVDSRNRIPIISWKNGAKEGDTWQVNVGEKRRIPAQVTFLKSEKITVPAGEYPSAFHVQAKWKEKGKDVVVDAFLVPGIGLVKLTGALEPGAVLELREFRGTIGK